MPRHKELNLAFVVAMGIMLIYRKTVAMTMM